MTTHLRRFFAVLLVFIVLGVGVLPAAAQNVTPAPRPAWNGQSRFTVLVMGLDRRPMERQNLNYRTDAVMLVSIHPAAQRIGILSIPRDTHVALPNIGEMVGVNTLVLRGEGQQPGYGPQLAIEALQYNLGIYIDSYVIFDFDAFIALIDALGGVEIDVPYNINDRSYPSMDFEYEPFMLRAGLHQMDGETALKYARTRHGDNDYMRGQRQMQVLTAVYERLLEPGALARLLPQFPALLGQLRDKIYTGLTLEEVAALAQAALTIPAQNITTGAIDQQYSIGYRLSSGQTVRIPDRENLALLMTQVFGENYWQ